MQFRKLCQRKKLYLYTYYLFFFFKSLGIRILKGVKLGTYCFSQGKKAGSNFSLKNTKGK